ncbi:hypothetical protein GBF35_03400 [Nonomuraea phyllanthi]|uniref:hypothetical protein n=1 Tax=Nonomuraea phyllanthi TaxID=2219224 RepID=UPI001293A7C3|nr:hypothetical protein [Nonomuraea phyllanthi]QFY05842.1 hypothetical protein GBF35_03400 [Nonomuraea phyllanthi]
MTEAARQVWPTVRSIPVSAVTDAKPPAHLGPARVERVAGTSGTGRDTAGGPGATADEGTGAKAEGRGAKAEGRGARAEGTGTRAGAGEGARPSGGRANGGATGVGTAGVRHRGTHARLDPAAELGFSGAPGEQGDAAEPMVHSQRTWDGTLATNRLDELGVNLERRRMETKDITVSVGMLVDGWPGDVRKSVQSVIDHTNARVLALDLGGLDGAGEVLDELAGRYPERIAVWHVTELPHWRGGTATWGESRTKLLQLDEAEVHVLMGTDVELRGDALTPLVAAVAQGAVAAGWHGADLPDADGDGAKAGKVGALGGELMAVRRAAALGAMPGDANYGRNADLELSLALDGDLIVPEETLPVAHLGEHKVDPEYDERESRRNHEAVLRILGTS